MPDVRLYLNEDLYNIFKSVPKGLRSKLVQIALLYYVKNHPEEFQMEDKKESDLI